MCTYSIIYYYITYCSSFNNTQLTSYGSNIIDLDSSKTEKHYGSRSINYSFIYILNQGKLLTFYWCILMMDEEMLFHIIDIIIY